MKIGLLTFHCSHNYGATLQGYALQEVLKELGHDVETIDYRPDFLVYPLYPKYLVATRNIPKLLEHLFYATISGLKRRKVFGRFIKQHFNLSKCINKDYIPESYDAVVIGSDQIWNLAITKGDTKYFADFGGKKGNRKYIAYAASMEAQTLSPEKEEVCRRCIPYFDSIAVRESNLIPLIQPFTNTKLEHVVDPALLINPKVWEDMAVKPKKERYVLLYQVRFNKQARVFAQKVADQYGVELIEIACTPKVERQKGVTVLHDATPEEFLGWIKYATCVVTSSYHGLVFSLVFKKEFYSLHLGDGADSRSSLLLKEIGIGDREIDINKYNKLSPLNNLDFKEIIENKRQNSIKFLQEQFIHTTI